MEERATHRSGLSAGVGPGWGLSLGICESLLVTTFTGVLRIPVVDRLVGGLPGRCGWSYTATPTEGELAGSIGLSAEAGLPDRVVSRGGLQA